MTCIICAKAEPHDGWTVCNGCLGRLDDDLARIVELTRLAADRLIRETKGSSNGSRSVPGSRPPLDLAALDAAMAVDALAILEIIEREWRAHRHLAAYGPASARRGPTRTEELTGAVGFLRSQLALMASDPDWFGLQCANQPTCPCDPCAVHRLAQTLERYNPDRNEKPGRVRVACPSDHPDADGRQCGYTLWTNGREVSDCPRCCTRWTADELLDAHEMELLPASVLIILDPDHPNPRKRIANWAARDRLTEHATAPNPGGGKPVPLYRLGEYRSLIRVTVTQRSDETG
jgi:hypothetical protein